MGSAAPATLDEERDGDLLLWMSMQEEDPAVAEEAWRIFYDRHYSYLFRVCVSRFRRFGVQPDEIAELVQDVFVRAYKKAGTFRPAAANHVGSEADSAQARAWLGTIAFNLLQDQFRQRPQLVLVDMDQAANTPVKEEAPKGEPSKRLKLIREALRLLPEREREVLLVSYTFYEPGRQLTIPEEDWQALADRWQTTAVNLRQIRSRAKKKIEDYIAEHEGD
jgi:RNA polymerase sigma factor (sigma-70 family)